jgi:hypothetical protein
MLLFFLSYLYIPFFLITILKVYKLYAMDDATVFLYLLVNRVSYASKKFAIYGIA